MKPALPPMNRNLHLTLWAGTLSPCLLLSYHYVIILYGCCSAVNYRLTLVGETNVHHEPKHHKLPLEV